MPAVGTGQYGTAIAGQLPDTASDCIRLGGWGSAVADRTHPVPTLIISAYLLSRLISAQPHCRTSVGVTASSILPPTEARASS